jgi:hypothetical protein
MMIPRRLVTATNASSSAALEFDSKSTADMAKPATDSNMAAPSDHETN